MRSRRVLPAAVLAAALALGPTATGWGGPSPPPARLAVAHSPARDPVPFQWVDTAGGQRVPLVGDDAATGWIDLGFAFPFYGARFHQASLTTNGLIAFEALGRKDYNNVRLPAGPGSGGALLAPFWDDLYVDEQSAVTVVRGGAAPARWLAATWERVGLVGLPEARISFQAVLYEDGRVTFAYSPASRVPAAAWDRATVGAQGPGGRRGITYRADGIGGPLGPGAVVAFAPQGSAGQGPEVVDLQVLPRVAGVYEVRARVLDPQGQGVAEVELQVQGLTQGSDATPVATQSLPFFPGAAREELVAFYYPGSVLAEGVYRFFLRARGGSGAWGEGAAQDVVVDRTPPASVCQAEGPAGAGGWRRGPVTFTCSAQDGVSGVARLEYRVDGGPWLAYGEPFQVAAEGDHQVYWRAIDLAGNVEPLRWQRVLVDGTPPQVAVSGLAPGATLRQSDVLQVQVAARDAGSGVAAVQVDVDENYDVGPAGLELWRLPLGVHVLNVRAWDWAGNEAVADPVVFQIFADAASLAQLTDRLAAWGLLLAGAVDLAAMRQALARAEALSGTDRWGARQALLEYLEVLQRVQSTGRVDDEAYAALRAGVRAAIQGLAGEEDCGC